MTTLTCGLIWLRRLRVAIYAVGVLATMMVAYPGGLSAMISGASEISELNAEMEQLKADRIRMEQECVLVANRIAIKEAMVEELIVGQRTLKEVTEEFARISANDPAHAHMLQNVYAASSELEFNAVNVLGYAEQRCGDGSVKDGVMHELHRQFHAMQAETAK